MKIAVIGLGSIGKRHVINLISSGIKPEDILGVDPREDRRQEAVKKFNLKKVFSQIQQLTAETFEGAVVCSPTSLHIEQATWLAEKGAYLVIEKPLGSNLDGIEDLLQAVKKNKREVLIAYPFRFSDHGRKLKELVQQEIVGKALYFRGEFSEYLPDWHPWEDYRTFYMAKKSLGGGSLLDQSHILDMSHFVFGPICEVHSCFNGRVSDLEVETDDMVEMLLRFESGLIGLVHQDMFGREHKKYMEVKCERGNIFWDVYDLSVSIYFAEEKRHEKFTFNKDHNRMYIKQTKHILEIFEGRATSLVPLAEGIFTMKVIESALKSSEEKSCCNIY